MVGQLDDGYFAFGVRAGDLERAPVAERPDRILRV
jgi:hypothetical protein